MILTILKKWKYASRNTYKGSGISLWTHKPTLVQCTEEVNKGHAYYKCDHPKKKHFRISEAPRGFAMPINLGECIAINKKDTKVSLSKPAQNRYTFN